jgi:hypothetical protein
VPSYEGIVGNETVDQLARMGSEHPFIGPEPESDQGLNKRKSKKILGILNWTQTGKRTYTRTLCQKNEGAVKIKQKPATMGGRTIYRTPI